MWGVGCRRMSEPKLATYTLAAHPAPWRALMGVWSVIRRRRVRTATTLAVHSALKRELIVVWSVYDAAGLLRGRGWRVALRSGMDRSSARGCRCRVFVEGKAVSRSPRLTRSATDEAPWS